nr:NADH dehydrogenase subunit 4 [Pingus sinensis]
MVGGLFFFDPVWFLFWLSAYFFFVLNDWSWGGVLFNYDSFVFLSLVFLGLYILGVVIFSEKSGPLVYLSELLVLACVLFFVPAGLIWMYIYFELTIFPILIMILGYGSQVEKVGAGFYLLTYTIFCSLPFLLIYFQSGAYWGLSYFDVLLSWEVALFLCLSFMVKLPVYFLHLWLPKAHVEAPTTASMLLAGLMLKLGSAGFLRIACSLSFIEVDFLFWVVLLGMILASFSCLFQSDAKSLAAYSSVSHMSFVLLMLLLFSMVGKTGSVLLMLSHGYVSTLMFFVVGEFFHLISSRMIYWMSGAFVSSIFVSVVFTLIFLCNSGLPPSISFLSEFMGVNGVFSFSVIFLLVLGFYYLVSFYYSLYFLTSILVGKFISGFSSWAFSYSVCLVVMSFNVFWLGLIY